MSGRPHRAAPPDRFVDLCELLPARGDLVIFHQDRRYRLHRTKQDKLILTRDETAFTSDRPPAELTRLRR